MMPNEAESVFLTGAEGSGKTSTCYYILKKLKKSKQIALYISGSNYSEEKMTFKQMVQKSYPCLTQTQLDVLEEYMKNDSKKITFVFDNVTLKETDNCGYSDSVPITKWAYNISKSDRAVFPQARIFFASSNIDYNNLLNATRAVIIQNLTTKAIISVAKSLDYDISKDLERYEWLNKVLCIPSLTKIGVEVIKKTEKDSFLFVPFLTEIIILFFQEDIKIMSLQEVWRKFPFNVESNYFLSYKRFLDEKSMMKKKFQKK